MQIKHHPLPFYNERKFPVSMLMLHSCAHDTLGTLNSLTNSELSCHYIVDMDGTITQVVDEKYRAYHAGHGFWRGIDQDLNSRSIGIEICNLTLGQTPFPTQQIKNLITLCQEIIARHNILPVNIIGHSDSAPERKPDPGFCFPWQELADQGIGLWFDPNHAGLIQTNDITELLSTIGYGTKDIKASAYAFCRHFLPEFVSRDNDVMHLVDHVLPESFDFMQTNRFLQTLKAVAYQYSKF